MTRLMIKKFEKLIISVSWSSFLNKKKNKGYCANDDNSRDYESDVHCTVNSLLFSYYRYYYYYLLLLGMLNGQTNIVR